MTDQLGTPRMLIDRTGSLAGVKRHDYLPFGEEIAAGVGGRTTNQGYSQFDGVRHGFTQYEKDDETGLNFAQARYYSPTQGRFTSVDPLLESADVLIPRSWNRYTYVLNNPLTYIDPTGMIWVKNGSDERIWIADKDWEAQSKLTDANGNRIYTALTADEMEYDSVTGERVRLLASGPTAENRRGFIFVGPNQGSGASSMLGVAGATALADGPEPFIGDLIGASIAVTALYHALTHENFGLPVIMSEDNSAEKPGPSTPTPHDEQRADEARAGDTHRQVGDPNRTVREGRTFIDTETGNRIHVRGNKVVVTDPVTGERITRFKNSRRNTEHRIRSGRWIPE